MRIKITFEAKNREVSLPIHYNYYIQSLIYKTFSSNLADLLHNKGFKFEERAFKLFTFSRIIEKGKKNGKKLTFNNVISFYFSSPFFNVVEDIALQSLKAPEVELLGQNLFVYSIQVIPTVKLGRKILIKMLSPVTMHSTLTKEDGRKISYYYKPIDREFSKLIEENARKKYFLIKGENTDKLSLEIKPIHFSVKRNLSIVKFKNTPIEAYTGIFELNGSKELIEITYDAGIGDRNPEGFGMWEIWKGGENA